MQMLDPRKQPKQWAAQNTFPHYVCGKLYMSAGDFLADFDASKPEEIEKPAEDLEDDDTSTDEAKDIRAKLKAAGVTGWGPRTKLEDLRKLAEGL